MSNSTQHEIEFERLQVTNFASYAGSHSIVLKPSSDRPVVIVMGGNGFGKSSLFDALNWALYGTLYERDLAQKRERSIVDYIYEGELRSAAAAGRSAEMSATIYFQMGADKFYITQELSVPVTGADSGDKRPRLGSPNRSTRTVQVMRDGNHRDLPYEGLLDQALPNNVRDYFLFDGDRIHSLSRPGSSQEVSDALRRVVDLDLLSEAEKDVREVARLFGRDANRLASGELKRIGTELEKVREAWQASREDLETLKAEERAIRDVRDQHAQRLSELAESKPYQERRNALEDKLRDLERERGQIFQRMRESIPTAGLSFAADSVTELALELDRLREAGELPAKISQTLLKDLLEMEACLCGTPLPEGSAAREQISERLARAKQRHDTQELLPVFYSLQSVSDSVGSALRSLTSERGLLDENMSSAHDEDIALKEVEDALSQLPNVDIADLERRRKKADDDLIENGRRQERQKNIIEGNSTTIEELRKQQEALEANQVEARRITARETLADEAADALSEIYRKFSDDSRRDVEALTSDRFTSFVPSASQYSVTLSGDYALSVLDSGGAPALQRLSMGQQQCLSLAFITSVSDVSGKHPPLAIDMPFGRLDGEVDRAVAEALTEMTHQLILFVLPDREWTDGIQTALRGKVAHLHRLGFDPKTRSTTITDEGTF